MRMLFLALMLFALLPVAARAHGDCHSWRDEGCSWHAHRRWFRHSHRHHHDYGHHHHHRCDHDDRHVCGPSLKDFPPDPVDGQKVRVRGEKWEWDADDNRWERD